MAVNVQVIYDPDGANLDISDDVLVRSARLQSAVSAQPGQWSCTVKDTARTHSFTTGKRVVWKADGRVVYGGFLMQIDRGFAFPADKTTPLSSVKTRQFTLRGVDYNILFDKRFWRDTSAYNKAPANENRNLDTYFITTRMPNFYDFPAWLDMSNGVVNVSYLPVDATNSITGDPLEFAWEQPGTPWRTQMEVLAAKNGAIWYIKPTSSGARLVWRGIEDNTAPYVLSDKPTGAEKGFRELDYLEDAAGMVNDAMVWGGKALSMSGDGVLFHREQNSSSITAHNRWQWAETHFEEQLYGSQNEVTNRAEVIVKGKPGAIPSENNRGLQNPAKNYRVTWHDRNVPLDGTGHLNLIEPGDLTTLKLHVFGNGVDPLIEVLPCRSVSMSFPSNAATGETYIRFEGDFGIQLSDPWTMWQAIRRIKKAAVRR